MKTLKNLFMLSLLMAITISAFAQPPALSKGTKMAFAYVKFATEGSKMKYDGNTYYTPRLFDIAIQPAIGGFVSDKVVFGWALVYNSSITRTISVYFNDDKDKERSTLNELMVGPWLRYYKAVGKRDFAALYFQWGLVYGPAWSKEVDKPADDVKTSRKNFDSHNIATGLGVGADFWPSDCVSLSFHLANIGLGVSTYKNNETKRRYTSSNFEFNHAFISMNIGVNYFFGYSGGNEKENQGNISTP